MIERDEAIRRAMEYPVAHITGRYADDQDLPLESAEEHERECKRYLALCGVNHGKNYGMRGPIDKYWHTFLMFTKEYAEFCDLVAGRFLHHVPKSSKTQGDERATGGGYRQMLQDYEQVFGEPAPPHLWPRRKASGANAMIEIDLCSFNLCSCDSCVGIPDPPDSCTQPVPNNNNDDD